MDEPEGEKRKGREKRDRHILILPRINHSRDCLADMYRLIGGLLGIGHRSGRGWTAFFI